MVYVLIFLARSATLKCMIEKLEDGSILKIDEFNGPTMKAVLHWLYTGNLSADADSVMGDMIKAAKKFELYQLLLICDRKLITICTTSNMFQLFQIAKDNLLIVGQRDIAKFIQG